MMVVYLFRHRFIRLPIVVIGVAAWLAISNHCALAAFEATAKMSTPSCHAAMPASYPSGKHDRENDIECCKVLRATLLTLSSNIGAWATIAFAAHDYVVALIPRVPEARLTCVVEWDTGPPGTDSFAESVLQRSILVHAPPSLS